MRSSSSFKVPNKYFKNFDVEILEKIKLNKNVFNVPENYFESISTERIIEKEKSKTFYKNLFITSSITLVLIILLVFNNFGEKEFVDETFLVNDILEENYDYIGEDLYINQYSKNYTYQNYDNQIIMSNLDNDFDYIIIE